MARTTTVPITGSVLRWAIDQAGLTVQELADSTRLPVGSIEHWIANEGEPRIGEIRKVADVLRRPVSVFYLANPPQDVEVPAALRRTSGANQRDLAPKQLRQVRRARRMQRLTRSLLTNKKSEPSQLPDLQGAIAPPEAGQELRGWLGVSIADQLEWSTAKQAFDEWRLALEGRGVFVLQLQLGQGLRGFSLQDDLAPIVSVNTAENYQARSFTLFHELAHLSSRTEGSCAERPGNSGDSLNIERWCEEVASAALLPPTAIRDVAGAAELSPDDEFGLVSHVADTFKTSLRATAIALIRERLVSRDVYDEIEERAPASDREKGFARGGGQRAPQRRLSEYGTRALSLIFDALQSQFLTERDARSYLRLDGAELDDLASQLMT